MVALWTSGPAGDQNLIASSWDLNDVLTHKVREPGEEGFKLSDSLGRILGEEAISAAAGIRNMSSSASIWSFSRDVTCPGHRLDQQLTNATNSNSTTLNPRSCTWIFW